MESLLFVPDPDELPVNVSEILRYAGMPKAADQTTELLRECLESVRPKLTYRVCFGSFPILHLQNGGVDLGFAKSESTALAKRLEGCDRIVAFAATVGIELDRMISRYATLSPAKALLLDAIGSERIEALCDLFEHKLSQSEAEEGRGTRARFSPGYGDLPLAIQEPLFAALQCQKKIGLCLGERMLISPSKSVTAIVGSYPRDSHAKGLGGTL